MDKNVTAIEDVDIELKDNNGNPFKFPKITQNIDKKVWDYYKLIRCKVIDEENTYPMKDKSGESVSNVEYDPNYRESRYLFAWNKAINDKRRCKIISDKVIANIFLDRTIENGKYIYYATACITPVKSQQGTDLCSYQISATNVFDFVGPTISDEQEILLK